MSVTISIGFKESNSQGSVLPGTIQGGIRVAVQEEELTALTCQSEMNKEKSQTRPHHTWWYDYQGNDLSAGKYDFKGDYIEAMLSVLVHVLEELGTGEINRHEEMTVDLPKSDYVLVLSYIDSTHEFLRMAFQGDQAGKKNSPRLKAAVGYPVPFDGLCRETARCLREYVEYARRSGFNPDEWESLREFESDAERLEKLADR